MALEFNYSEEAARGADKNADRITDSGAYVGKLTRAYATTAGTGTQGIQCEFSGPQGTADFQLWTHDENGHPKPSSPGFAFLNSLMFFFGLKTLHAERGTAEVWKDVPGKDKREKVEEEVDTFPELCDKTIGLVLQRDNGDNGYRMNLYGVFDPTTRKTMTETKENVAKATKLDRMLKGLKDKNSRTKARRDEAEPGQPGVGADMSD